ncbi:MAG: toprim domain-containing protein, partial [Mycoplasma sp.]
SFGVYALNFAKNSKGKTLILCEGYMDVIAMHQNGIWNAVAVLGTSLAQEQVRLISRNASDVVISFDSDEAGIGEVNIVYKYQRWHIIKK